MRFREALTGDRHPRVAAIATLCALALTLAACGEDDFPNDPRPPSPVELTAAIDQRSVNVSPSEVGAGIVNLTISNQTDEPTTLTLAGPTEASSGEIPAGGTGSLKTTLEEGEYEITADSGADVRPQTLTVGPERESSQNDLLLP